MRKFILLLLLAGMTLLCSCELFSKDETVEFELPQWPDYLPQLQGWEISGVAELVEAPPDRRHVSFRLPRNKPVCITATPITEVPFFKQAGTIYPYSQKITWSGGYAAYLFKIIPGDEQFNWEKLLETLEGCENPWLLDSQKVLEGIAYNSFSAGRLKITNSLCIPLDFDVFSSYVPENHTIQAAGTVTVIKNQPELFALRRGSGTPFYAVIISAASAKNISLDLVSLPIIKEGL